jgi:hypothetical protein
VKFALIAAEKAQHPVRTLCHEGAVLVGHGEAMVERPGVIREKGWRRRGAERHDPVDPGGRGAVHVPKFGT